MLFLDLSDGVVYIISEYVGEIGEKVTVIVRIKRVRYFEGMYGPMGIYQFEDKSGNVIVWMTDPNRDFEEDTAYELTGTVKDHSEFRGVKQTKLTRCKVKEA